MLSLYKINPNITNNRMKKASNSNFDNNSHHESNVKRPQTKQLKIKRIN